MTATSRAYVAMVAVVIALIAGSALAQRKQARIPNESQEQQAQTAVADLFYAINNRMSGMASSAFAPLRRRVTATQT